MYYYSYTLLYSGESGTSTQCTNAKLQFKVASGVTGTLTVGGTSDTGNHYNSVIGGTDNDDYVNGIEIQGGTIFAGAKFDDNCTAIGGGGNGYGKVSISGGTVTAVSSSTGCAIGGGIGWSSAGGAGDVTISGGTVYAYNHGFGSGTGVYKFVPATAIGGASSGQSAGNTGTVTISAGTVYAQSTGGTAIGGGGSADSSGGTATVTISGSANVTAKSVSGTVNNQSVAAGTSIGGGTGKTAGGNVTFKMTGGTLKTGSVGGGKKTSASNEYGSGTVTIEGGTINGQFVLSPPAGGHSSFTMKGGTINGKLDGFTYMQPDGYAVWMNDSGGTVTINQSVGTSKISGCTGAGNGGAIYMLSGTFTLTAGTIEKCSATNGGAVYMGGGTFNMNGGTIGGISDTYANSATGQGGGIYMGGGTFTMKGGTISYNKTQKNENNSHGGGVYIASGGTVTINGGTISNNTANYGGGFYVNPGASATTIINNLSANTTISGNKARYGAGAFIETGSISVSSTNSRTTKIENNIADYSGGGLYVKGSASLTGVLLNNNQANGTDAENRGGGGMFVTGNHDNSISGGEVNNNTAENKGGGVYVNAGANYTLEISGTAKMNSNQANYGGGAYIAAGKLKVTGTNASNVVQIMSNTATTDGGGVYAAAGSVTASNASINSNTATNGNGGGIYAVGAVTVTGGTVSGNHADKNATDCGQGGGIYALAGSNTITVQTSATVGSNTAKQGAGIYAASGSVEVNSSTLSGNVASSDGGGVYAAGGSVTTTTATLSSNSATSGNGGGIYGGGGNITVNAGSIATNTANSGNGGGVYATGGTINFNASSKANPNFTGNTAINGGVLYMEGGTCNINAGTLGGSHANRNKATTSGGAIYVNEGTVNFATGEISFNTAGTSGGGIFVADNGTDYGTLNMTGDVTLSKNHVPAGKHGGGVYLAGVISIGSSTERTVLAQDNFASGTVDTDPGSVTIDATNRNNVYLPNPTVNTGHKDVITVVKNGLTTSTRVGFSVPANFVPVIYCNENPSYTYLQSFLSGGAMASTVFDDSEKYTTVHISNNSFYDPQHIYLSGGTWVDHVNTYSSAPEGFSVSGNNITISSSEGLAWLIKYINGIAPVTTTPQSGVNVILTADLDMGDYAWVPMGYTQNSTVFTGTFDGQGHTISNLICQYLGTQTGNNLGLFGTVGSNATIKNVQLMDAKLNTSNMDSGVALIGSIAGQSTGGTVMNCVADAEIETLNSNTIMGGLVGKMSGGEIHSSYALPVMTGYTMGGLVGELSSGNLYNSFANPQFNYSGPYTDPEDPNTDINLYVGGLVADNGTNGTVQNCYVRFSRTQTLTNALFGQLAGNNEGSITDCYTPLNYTSDVPATIVRTGSATSDTYKVADAPYKYDRPNDNKVGSTVETLTEKLNEWVSGQHNSHPEYAYWKRTTAGNYTTGSGNINDDYPIHKMVGLSNAASPDGLFIEYKYSLNAMLTKYNDLEDGGTVWVYDSPLSTMTASGGTPSYESVSVDNNATKVKLYIDEDASLLQSYDPENTSANNTLTAYTGQTLRNYSSNANRWHNVSSSLKQSGIGFDYYNDGHGQHADFNWDINPCNIALSADNDNAFFPSDLPWPATAQMDFYCFYEPEYHWINLKRRTDSHWHMNATTVPIVYNGNGIGANTNGNETYMVPGKGYLVSIDKDQLIQNKGELNNGTVTLYSVTKTDANAWAGLLGYNLLGNPYQSYLDFEQFKATNSGLWAGTNEYNQTYATFDPKQNTYMQYKYDVSYGAKTASQYIHPHQGFFIRKTAANSGNNTVTFTNDMRTNTTDEQSGFRGAGQPRHALVNFVVRDAQGKGDIAVLELNRDGDEGAEKIRMGDGAGHVSLGYESKAYAILFRTKVEGYQPLWFEATEAGTFTLGWDIHNAVFESLTLVDNITGTSTDMLATDTYTFQGSPDHYDSRFKVVIGDYVEVDPDAPVEPVEGPTFAFIVGDELVVDGEGTLQVFDVMGRQLVTQELHGSQSRIAKPTTAGVYLLRLTDGNGTRTQKIVVE